MSVPEIYVSGDEERQRQIEELAKMLSALEERIPTEQELAWLRERRIEAERVEWLRAQIKRHAPWVLTVSGIVGGVVAWLVNHSVHVTSK